MMFRTSHVISWIMFQVFVLYSCCFTAKVVVYVLMFIVMLIMSNFPHDFRLFNLLFCSLRAAVTSWLLYSPDLGNKNVHCPLVKIFIIFTSKVLPLLFLICCLNYGRLFSWWFVCFEDSGPRNKQCSCSFLFPNDATCCALLHFSFCWCLFSLNLTDSLDHI